MQKGGIAGVTRIPEKLRALLATAHEIPWDHHLAHQQAFQEYTDNAVSKTINLRGNTRETEVSSIYFQAWERGLKGITIYRDGSKNAQVFRHCRGAVSCEL